MWFVLHFILTQTIGDFKDRCVVTLRIDVSMEWELLVHVLVLVSVDKLISLALSLYLASKVSESSGITTPLWDSGALKYYTVHCVCVVSLLAEDDTIASRLKMLGVKTQTIKEVQQAQPNPIRVLAAKHLSVAYQEMGKIAFN